MKKTDGNTFHGVCQAGQDFPASTCNSKVLAARYYSTFVTEQGGPSALVPQESLSPRDGNSHGTHTSSTAAGNPVKHVEDPWRRLRDRLGHGARRQAVRLQGALEPQGRTRARPAATTRTSSPRSTRPSPTASTSSTTPSGSGLASTSSTSRSCTPPRPGSSSPASAGNSGPGANTVEHVGALGDHGRGHHRAPLRGHRRPGQRQEVPRRQPDPAPRRARDARGPGRLGRRAPGAAARTHRLCAPGSLDPAKVTGKVVVCDRGVNDRVAKSRRGQAGRRRRHGAREHEPEQRSTPTCTPCRRFTSTRWPARRSRPTWPSTANPTIAFQPATPRACRPRRSRRSPASPRAGPSEDTGGTCSSPTSLRPASASSPPSRRRGTRATSTGPNPARRCRRRTSPGSPR